VTDQVIAADLGTFGAVILQGPRACGKTTTALKICASSVRLDADTGAAQLAELSPASLLGGSTPRLIDEWQRAPALWNAIRHEVDQRQTPGQFILTSSATPSEDDQRHSGAGRFGRVTMRTMSLYESGESTGEVSLEALLAGEPVSGLGGLTVAEYARVTARGGWPRLIGSSSAKPQRYLTAYLDDIARVDLRIGGVSVDPMRMSAVIRAIARNVATEASAARLGREAQLAGSNRGVSEKTVRGYLDALTRVFVVEEQPAWPVELRSAVRLRVAPKWHFIDPSLAATMLGADERRLLGDLNTFGFLFESLCVRDLRIYGEALGAQLSHYRDASGLEIDAILERRDGRWAAFEVKLGGERAIDAAAASLLALRAKVSQQRADDCAALSVLTAGSASYTRADGINVVVLGHLKP
jgi:predicted AAA+ superfamily ATPase